MPTLILFDIDGTLMSSAGVGRLALRRTLMRLFGDDTAALSVPLSGRVDWAIWRAILDQLGYSQDEVDAQLHDYYKLYVAELAVILSDASLPRPQLLPGVLPLLQALQQRNDVLLGVLTGNVETAAWLKLGYAQIAAYFYFGAFGSDAPSRDLLPVIAVARAATFADGYSFRGSEIVIIGDTVHDVTCGAALGVRTLAVATGTDDIETLQQAGASQVVPSLADTDTILNWLMT